MAFDQTGIYYPKHYRADLDRESYGNVGARDFFELVFTENYEDVRRNKILRSWDLIAENELNTIVNDAKYFNEMNGMTYYHTPIIHRSRNDISIMMNCGFNETRVMKWDSDGIMTLYVFTTNDTATVHRQYYI